MINSSRNTNFPETFLKILCIVIKIFAFALNNVCTPYVLPACGTQKLPDKIGNISENRGYFEKKLKDKC